MTTPNKIIALTTLLWVSALAYSWAQTVPLTVQRLEAVNVTMEEVSFKGKKAIRVNPTSADAETIAILKGTTFENGTITLQVAGQTLPSASTTARGFIGLAFSRACG